MSGARTVKYNRELNHRLNLDLSYHNVRSSRNSSGTDNMIGMKPGDEMSIATASSGVTTNRGAPGNGSASASGNAHCWNASAGYTVPTRTPIEITVTTAITITGMVTPATA